MNRAYSWGNIPRVEQQVVPFDWPDRALPETSGSVLACGLGRSYGDSCLNADGTVLSTRRLDRFINWDAGSGVLSCAAGVQLAEILELVVPQGWFLPVTPGTRFVTVGGAIANDVHGKNHHSAGSFGHWVESFDLLRTDRGRVNCSATENPDLFYATIGGLGLTGLILSASFRLKRVTSDYIDTETIKFRSLAEFRVLSAESAASHEYVVAWFDCMGSREGAVSGLFSRGNHAPDSVSEKNPGRKKQLPVPFPLPKFAMSPIFIRAFNKYYFTRQRSEKKQARIHYEPFLYPLDSLKNWNRIYGRDGFYQYQCVLPPENSEAMEDILAIINRSGMGSFLAVLKEFGNESSLGLLSFPRPGITLALDFPNRGQKTLDLFEQMDKVVMDAHGAIYPAKDARMPPSVFAASFPRWKEFSSHVDPGFSSSFWRRVTAGL